MSDIVERAGEKKPYVVSGDIHFQHISSVPKRRFLVAYSETGDLTKAAEIAEIARATHYNWKHDDLEYAEAFETAKAIAADRLESEARRRAVDGVDDPVFFQGKVVGHIRRYSDNLLLAMLKAHKKSLYAERIQQEDITKNPLSLVKDLKNMNPEKLALLEQLLGEAYETTTDD